MYFSSIVTVETSLKCHSITEKIFMQSVNSLTIFTNQRINSDIIKQ